TLQARETGVPHAVFVAFLAEPEAQDALPGIRDRVGAGERVRLLAGQRVRGVCPLTGVVFAVDIAVVEGEAQVLVGRPAVAERAGKGVLLVAVVIGMVVAKGNGLRRCAVAAAVGAAGGKAVFPAVARARDPVAARTVSWLPMPRSAQAVSGRSVSPLRVMM